jgi:hypothetical protein
MADTALHTVETARAGDRERAQTANDLGQALTHGFLTLPE